MKTKLCTAGAEHKLQMDIPEGVRLNIGSSHPVKLEYQKGPVPWPHPQVTFYPHKARA